MKLYNVSHWLRQGVYEFLSSSMMETMRVMSLDQKSRFLMLGPCSSGGTALLWKGKREERVHKSAPFVVRRQTAGEQKMPLEPVCVSRIGSLRGLTGSV